MLVDTKHILGEDEPDWENMLSALSVAYLMDAMKTMSREELDNLGKLLDIRYKELEAEGC